MLLITWTAALGLGCGSASTLDGGHYADDQARYRIGRLDTAWRRLHVEPGEESADNDLAWHHPELEAVIQVNASCRADLDIPLLALTNHLLFGFTDRQIDTQTHLPLDGREALLTHATARIDGVPRELLLTVLKKDGCVWDFALVAPPGQAFARARDSYDRVLAGFHAEVTP